MNVNPFTKKSAAAANHKTVKGASPLNEIGDISAVAQMFDRLRQQNAQYDQAIAALVAANRITCGWDKPAEPEMTLTIQREVLLALGDAEALAKFDQEHQQALAQEQAARVKATQQVLEAPTRVKALEQYLDDLAEQMEDEYDQILVEREAERIFAPSARRMVAAAKALCKRGGKCKPWKPSCSAGFGCLNTALPANTVTARACRPSCAWMCEGCRHGNPAIAPAPTRSLRAAVAAYRTRARGAGTPAHATAVIATGSACRHHA